MSDYRNSFINSVEQSLVSILSQQDLESVMTTVTMILNNYEIMERCTDLVPVDGTNEKLLKRYCACMMVDGKSKGTIAQYKRNLQRLSDFLQKPFTEIGTYDIRFYLASEKQRGISNTTLETIRAQLSAFFHWMTIEEITPRNVMDPIKPIKCPVEVKKPFSDVEIDRLRSACKTFKERALVEFLLSSGVRVEELSDMEISDVHMAKRTVRVRHGKGDKERITYMSNVCATHLKTYLESRKDALPNLFLNKNSGKMLPGGIRFVLNGIAKRAGVPNTHPHRFRRTFATGLAARGMDIQEIQKLMGHADINTTMTYVYTNDEQVMNSYNKYIA